MFPPNKHLLLPALLFAPLTTSALLAPLHQIQMRAHLPMCSLFWSLSASLCYFSHKFPSNPSWMSGLAVQVDSELLQGKDPKFQFLFPCITHALYAWLWLGPRSRQFCLGQAHLFALWSLGTWAGALYVCDLLIFSPIAVKVLPIMLFSPQLTPCLLRLRSVHIRFLRDDSAA